MVPFNSMESEVPSRHCPPHCCRELGLGQEEMEGPGNQNPSGKEGKGNARH